MDKMKKTAKGFAIRRRCDKCGIVMAVIVDENEKSTLKCCQCGREYKFSCKGV